MGRGKLKPETKQKRALNQVQAYLASIGKTPEEIQSIPEVEAPAETALDKIKEAEAAIIYFGTNGSQFKRKICKTCGEEFAYRWEVDSITRCSVDCYKKHLREELHLDWHPERSQADRWGPAAPVVVPPGALKILDSQLNDFPEGQHPGIA